MKTPTSPEVFLEERRFYQETFGWDDRRIAERLGYSWTSYLRIFLRHPEFGPINDPEARERKAVSDLLAAVSSRAQYRRTSDRKD